MKLSIIVIDLVQKGLLCSSLPKPMSNDITRQSIASVFGKVVKITEKKKHKDGLLSGIRILSMKKDKLDSNPLPSYIKIDGFELYVTYQGQEITCKYCGDTWHLQVHCKKHLMDYPPLAVKLAKDESFKAAAHLRRNENESRASTKFVQLHRNETTSGEAFVSITDSEKPLNLVKKR